MGKTGFCTINGTLDDSRFNEPMPWIGMYVVAASAACTLAMTLDTIHGFRFRNFWFPSKFFALNATTLTLIGVAVKLGVDLNTSMPRSQAQLVKLSSTTFICTAIGNSMPSLGTMETKELMMNVVALGILVITLLVNICIQLGTGVIYEFWIEHVIVMFLVLVLLGILISTAFAIPYIKYYLNMKCKKKYRRALRECNDNGDSRIDMTLRDDVMRYWMIAHTCNPQFVVGRLATCSASGVFCLLGALTLAEAILRNFLMPWSFTFCEGESDYKGSSMLILVTQAFAIVVGTIGPASRWFIITKFRGCKKTNFSYKSEISVEHYWFHKLGKWKEYELDMRIYNRLVRKLVHNTKNKALDLCIWFQKSVVLLSKFVRLLSILIMSRLMIIHSILNKLATFMRRKNIHVMNCEAESSVGLNRFVVHLEGEEELIDLMTQSQRESMGHWIRVGRKNQPTDLIRFLERLNSSRGFEGVQKFDSHLVPSLDSEEPPNCWALPIVTLASIVIPIGGKDFKKVRELMKCVNQRLKYIRIIENNLQIKRDLVNVKKAAKIVWVGVDLHYRWLDVNLRGIADQGENPKEIVSKLCGIAESRFFELRKNDQLGWLRDSPSKWSIRVLAANSMYRICQSLLLPDCTSNEDSIEVFERITTMITDIMGACLMNLQHVISIKCHHNMIQEREQSVRSAILLLGKTEKILEILGKKPIPCLDPDHLACINEWREVSLGKDPLFCSTSSPTNSDSKFNISTEVHLDIDKELD